MTGWWRSIEKGSQQTVNGEYMSMIKQIIRKAFRRFGLQIIRLPERQRMNCSAPESERQDEIKKLYDALIADPLNNHLHLQYSDYASRNGKPYLAYAEMKTAEVLGAERDIVDSKLSEIRESLPDSKYMNHNQYYRFITLASEITSRAKGSSVSVLDVGGGGGQLASFIPEASYCLAEPTVNGISGIDLPFADHSFDFVVSCHVLEHIPVEDRVGFLDQLLRKAKRGIILLNPFHVKDTYAEERLKLVVKITDEPWAKEHLECTLPKVEEIEEYANQRGLDICIKANGTMTTTSAFVFIDHFAAKAGLRAERDEINALFNEKYTSILDSQEYPTAHLIYLGWPESFCQKRDENE
jgi:2-polyprenyl-3-methyl-5-hydroxy-6-metoxy-1,4-benzoquinol methylase